MARARFAGFVLGALASAAPLAAQSLTLGERWILHSTVLGEDRPIIVRVPADYDSVGGHYPVVVVLDAEGLFVPAAASADVLPWAFRGPETILVGVPNTQRVRDMTTRWTSHVTAGGASWMIPNAGGAANFLRFLEFELIPEIDRRYRTTPFRVLVGQSLSALFALHAAYGAPSLFRVIVAASPPAFWNGDEVIDSLARTIALPGGPRLFVTRAEKEFDDTPRAFEKLDELLRLRAAPNLRWEMKIERGDHGTAMLPALADGLEFAFLEWRLPSLVFDEGLDSIESFYRRISRDYGLTVLPPERELMALATRARVAGRPQALHILQRCADMYRASNLCPPAFAALRDSVGRSGN